MLRMGLGSIVTILFRNALKIGRLGRRNHFVPTKNPQPASFALKILLAENYYGPKKGLLENC